MCEILPKMHKICLKLLLKFFSFWGPPQTPYRGSAPGPRCRGTPVHQTPCGSAPIPNLLPPPMSLVLSRLDYCNALLHGAPTPATSTSFRVSKTVQLGSFYTRQGGHIPSHYSTCCTGCRSNSEARTSWLADVQSPHHLDTVMSQPTHQSSRYIRRTLRSSSATALSEPFANTPFGKRAFHCSAPSTWKLDLSPTYCY